MYYKVLPARKIPQEFLTYYSDLNLVIGQLVEVPIQNKSVKGIVVDRLNKANYDKSKIKYIEKFYPFNFSNDYLNLIKIISRNTFNSVNLILESLIRPFELLTIRDLEKITQRYTIKKNELTSAGKKSLKFKKINDISIRIISIIRSQIHNSQILFIFPEKKLLDKVLSELSLDQNEYSIYFGDKSKTSKQAVKDLILYNSKKNIFSLRSGLFLPFSSLSKIVLVDEANTMYIQEQNKVYFDTRDLVYIYKEVLELELEFLSNVPSVRLQDFYQESLLVDDMVTSALKKEKPLRIQITERNQKHDEFTLFSNYVQSLFDEDLDEELN